MCLEVLLACVSVHRILKETRTGIRASGTGVTDGCELLCGFWESNLSIWRSSQCFQSLLSPYHCFKALRPGPGAWRSADSVLFLLLQHFHHVSGSLESSMSTFDGHCCRVLRGTSGLVPTGAANVLGDGHTAKEAGSAKGKVHKRRNVPGTTNGMTCETPSICKVSETSPSPLPQAKTQT